MNDFLKKYPTPWVLDHNDTCIRDTTGKFIAKHDPYGGPWPQGAELVAFVNDLTARKTSRHDYTDAEIRECSKIFAKASGCHEGEGGHCSSCRVQTEEILNGEHEDVSVEARDAVLDYVAAFLT